MRTLLFLPFIAACATTTTQAPAPTTVAVPDMAIEVVEEGPTALTNDVMLEVAVRHPARTEADVARDSYRHPAETLAFFGVEPTDHVLDLWAGGGWYSRILAPYVASGGHLHVTQYAEDAEPSYRGTHATRWQAYRTENGLEASTSTITLTAEDPQLGLTEAVDVVLTFRNVHNWAKADIDTSIYTQSFTALKPGGTFGIVDHSGPGMTREQSADSGYMDQQAIIDAVTAVGFVFEEASDINANPLDTYDHPEGVWTLPPSFKLEDVDRETYAAIGESNRMTLRFRKPTE